MLEVAVAVGRLFGRAGSLHQMVGFLLESSTWSASSLWALPTAASTTSTVHFLGVMVDGVKWGPGMDWGIWRS